MRSPKHIFALTADFNSGVRISDAARSLGARCTVVRGPADLPAKLAAGAPDLVVLDLQVGGFDPAVVVQQVGQGSGLPRVIAFGRHTDAASLRAARQAGCADILVRSDFFPKLADVLAQHLSLAPQREQTVS